MSKKIMSEKESLNYETFLNLKEWSLDFAISLIHGYNPIKPARDKFGKTLIQNQNSRTWEIAENAIKNGSLSAVKKTKFEEYDFLELFSDYEYSEETHFVKPKDFVKWCNENEMLVEPELNQYFDYKYWRHKEYWTFDEAVMVILSKNIPPLPNEIRNVFEIDDEHFRCAKNLWELLNKTHSIAFKINSAGLMQSYLGTSNIKGLFLDKKKLLLAIKSEEGKSLQLVIKPLEIDSLSEVLLRREAAKKVKIEKITKSESSYEHRINHSSWINKALWSIDEALDIISGLNPDDYLFSDYNDDLYRGVTGIIPIPKWLSYKICNRLDYEELLLHDFRLGIADFLIDARLIEGKKSLLSQDRKSFLKCRESLYGSVKPKDFIKWAKSHELKIPKGLENKQESITYQNSSQYTTPYINLMFKAIEHFEITKEKQPLKKNITGYLEDELRKIEDKSPANKANMMATFLRMPESQSGGNKKFKQKG